MSKLPNSLLLMLYDTIRYTTTPRAFYQRAQLVHFSLAKVHFRVLVLELLEDIHLLLLVGAGQTLLLLSLVKHHFLDHAAGLAVQVRQLGVIGLNLGDVNLGGICDNVRPPLHLVDLVEVDFDRLGTVGVAGEGPG